jgi:hypothetical protein
MASFEVSELGELGGQLYPSLTGYLSVFVVKKPTSALFCAGNNGQSSNTLIGELKAGPKMKGHDNQVMTKRMTAAGQFRSLALWLRRAIWLRDDHFVSVYSVRNGNRGTLHSTRSHEP